MSIIQVDKIRCVGCNACVRACPVGDANVAKMDDEGNLRIMIDEENVSNVVPVFKHVLMMPERLRMTLSHL